MEVDGHWATPEKITWQDRTLGRFFFAWQCTGMFTDKRQRPYTKCLIERSHSFQAKFIVRCTFHDDANLYEDTTSPISQTGRSQRRGSREITQEVVWGPPPGVHCACRSKKLYALPSPQALSTLACGGFLNKVFSFRFLCGRANKEVGFGQTNKSKK